MLNAVFSDLRRWRNCIRAERELAHLSKHLREDIGLENLSVLDERTRSRFVVNCRGHR